MRVFDSRLQRRDWLRLSAAGMLTCVNVPWFESLADAAIERPRGKSCILLWMDGGPSQQHTFDPKESGEFKSTQTSVPGIQIVEQLPQLAQCMDDMVLVRSMTLPLRTVNSPIQGVLRIGLSGLGWATQES